jgi:DNA repair protein RadC
MKTDYRVLSDSEILYHITNSQEKTVQYVGKLTRCEMTSVEELFSQLTPARKALAEAAIELYKRLQIKQAERQQVISSDTVCEILRPLIGDIEKEEFWAVYLNQSNRIIRKERLSVGGIAGTYVDIRLIMKEAILCNATGMIISHNHPSGNENPSPEDNRITEQLKKAADSLNIRLTDHIIITSNTYYSYVENGML